MIYQFSLILFCFLIIPAAFAQNFSIRDLHENFGRKATTLDDVRNYNINSQDYQNSNYLNNKKSSYFNTTGMDQQLDQDKYLIGTGDGFSIYVWGP